MENIPSFNFYNFIFCTYSGVHCWGFSFESILFCEAGNDSDLIPALISSYSLRASSFKNWEKNGFQNCRYPSKILTTKDNTKLGFAGKLHNSSKI